MDKNLLNTLFSILSRTTKSDKDKKGISFVNSLISSFMPTGPPDMFGFQNKGNRRPTMDYRYFEDTEDWGYTNQPNRRSTMDYNYFKDTLNI